MVMALFIARGLGRNYQEHNEDNEVHETAVAEK